MDLDQTQAIYDYDDGEEEKVEQNKTHPEKKEVIWQKKNILIINSCTCADFNLASC